MTVPERYTAAPLVEAKQAAREARHSRLPVGYTTSYVKLTSNATTSRFRAYIYPVRIVKRMARKL